MAECDHDRDLQKVAHSASLSGPSLTIANLCLRDPAQLFESWPSGNLDDEEERQMIEMGALIDNRRYFDRIMH